MIDINETIVKNFKKSFKELIDTYKKLDLYKTSKQLSEDISGLLENSIAKYYPNVTAPKKDSEPDLLIDGKIGVEIKTTSGETWRGGSYSKRPGYYVLVSWEIIDEKIKLFIAGIELTEEDWVGKGGNYYATTFGKKDLASRDHVVYCGKIHKYNRGTQQCVRITCE